MDVTEADEMIPLSSKLREHSKPEMEQSLRSTLRTRRASSCRYWQSSRWETESCDGGGESILLSGCESKLLSEGSSSVMELGPTAVPLEVAMALKRRPADFERHASHCCYCCAMTDVDTRHQLFSTDTTLGMCVYMIDWRTVT